MPGEVTIAAVIEAAKTRLKNAGISENSIEAKSLARHTFVLDNAALISKANEVVDNNDLVKFDAIVERRISGEPVGRIIGSREFYGLEFSLSPATLEPRADTEILVDHILQDYSGNAEPLRILDLGTGTGAIIISILKNLANAKGVATDISSDALAAAKHNAKNHLVNDRVEFIQSNWCENVSEPFDVIASNPPYIRSDIIPTLEPQVRQHDPILALDGGASGLDAYGEILSQCGTKLRTGGRIYLEIGFDQKMAVYNLASDLGWRIIDCVKDYGENDRLIIAEFRSN